VGRPAEVAPADQAPAVDEASHVSSPERKAQ